MIEVVNVMSYSPAMRVSGGKTGLTKAEAYEVIYQIEEVYGLEEFMTIYFNVGKNKDLRFCDDTDEARQVIDGINEHAIIAIEVDDLLLQRVGDLDKAWKQLSGEELEE